MPVYNCDTYVQDALESILNQTVRDLELIVIDDASTDGTVSVIESVHDDRIHLIKKLENTGYTNSLNIGFEIATGKYIARMDGDDISLPTRFQKQLEFFERHPQAVACGTNYRVLNSVKNSDHPEFADKTKVYLLAGCYVAHPSAMFKKSVVIENGIHYNPDYEPAEDYNFWVALSKYGDIGNVKEALLLYRTHERQVSLRQSDRQMKYTDVARRTMLQYLLPENEISQIDWEVHLSLMKGWGSETIKRQELISWIKRLETENAIRKVFHAEYLEEFLEEKLQLFLKNRKDSRVPLAKKLDWKSREIAKKVLISLKLRTAP